ncbi:MAG TPA: polysaccharide ABC transporter ATP-binding protein [Anaerolineae bacterium]|nr:polysaccharide ABC transporter ATP-binding protein [Anaerolineae bacterium]
MTNPVIRVENLGKRYRIVTPEKRQVSMRDAAFSLVASPFAYLRRTLREPTEEEILWALRDVSFEVEQGEVLGIIGRNGAGKSTLLKILSRITDPTEGRAILNGRVGALLEVGTGFHPELTGRENIYLSASILGMNRREITRKIDEIIDFAGIEKFIDTPVKRYSSGMNVRLGFSVAAHLEPEILIIDEVLAVGDIAFQFKCIDKMEAITREGRTVLFVSHSMSTISRMCNRVILLDKGRIAKDDITQRVVPEYLTASYKVTSLREWDDLDEAPGDATVRLRRVRVCDENGNTVSSIDIRCPVGVEVVYDVLQPGHTLVPNLHFFNEESVRVFTVLDARSEWRHKLREVGRYVTTAWIPGNLLSESSMFVSVAISEYYPMVIHLMEREVVAFQVIDSLHEDSARGDYRGPLLGAVRPIVKWTTRALSD